MKFKNTFYNWLTNRFILIIRNEENFAVKKTFSFNYAKLIVYSLTLILTIFLFSFYLVNTALSKWFNPRHAQLQTSKKIILLSSRVDSLAFELERKDVYIEHFKRLITGDTTLSYDEKKENQNLTNISSVNVEKISPEDSLLRHKFEQEAIQAGSRKRSTGIDGLYFYSPVEGRIIRRFDLLKRFQGIEVSVSGEQPVKSMIGGQIIHAQNETSGSFVIVFTEKNHLIQKFRFKGELVKNVGEKVEAGEVIGTVKENKIFYTEIWHEGKPVDPLVFVKF